MVHELVTAVSAASPRQGDGLAPLREQLRAAQQEALAAERAVQDVRSDGAEAQLRDRLRATLDERRAQLDAEVARAREESAVTIAAAHRAARVMTSRATTTARQAAEPAVDTIPALSTFAAVPTAPLLASASAPDVWTGRPASEALSDVGASAPSYNSVAAFDPQQVAAVFATMLDERMSNWAPAPEPRKPSFWSHIFHLDVMIVVLVMILCLIVVAAWMS
ncbi:MAG: hypothetical protein WCK21_12005 [Actinomycetota bacterium]